MSEEEEEEEERNKKLRAPSFFRSARPDIKLFSPSAKPSNKRIINSDWRRSVQTIINHMATSQILAL